MIFTIVHLYSKEMNIYGDMGNILALKVRMQERGFEVCIINVGLGKLLPMKLPKGDLYFMGGGQDDDMYKVFDDLVKYKKEFLEQEVEANKVFLIICGAFQLFGEYFLDSDGRQMRGLGILPINTKAPSDQIKDRCVGNIVSEFRPEIIKEMEDFDIAMKSKYLVGFENHSGQTYFEVENVSEKIQPIGNVIFGNGNNSVQKIEGARYKNVFGSYLHGSVLPKNPHFTDLLLALALSGKENTKLQLGKLDDGIEWQAHNAIIDRFIK